MTTRSLLLVDDYPELGDALRRAMPRGWRVKQVGSVDAGLRALEGVEWDAVIVDVRLGEEDGLGFLQQAKKRCPETAFLVMTSDGREEGARRAAGLGAAYLRKPAGIAVMRAWLREVEAQRPVPKRDDVVAGEEVRHEAETAIEHFAREFGLTPAETRVLALAAQGYTRRKIAERLDITVHTYQKHARAVRDKTGEAVAQAAIRVLRGSLGVPAPTPPRPRLPRRRRRPTPARRD